MLERPEVSVLTPTYNDSRYIDEAVESLLNQSYKDLELIIISLLIKDGSLRRKIGREARHLIEHGEFLAKSMSNKMWIKLRQYLGATSSITFRECDR